MLENEGLIRDFGLGFGFGLRARRHRLYTMWWLTGQSCRLFIQVVPMPTRRATSMTHTQHWVSGHASRGMTWIYRSCRALDHGYAGLCPDCLLDPGGFGFVSPFKI